LIPDKSYHIMFLKTGAFLEGISVNIQAKMSMHVPKTE